MSRKANVLSPAKTIRKHCLECADTSPEVEKCQCPECHLWPWRFGRRPETAERKGKLVDPDLFVPEPLPWEEKTNAE